MADFGASFSSKSSSPSSSSYGAPASSNTRVSATGTASSASASSASPDDSSSQTDGPKNESSANQSAMKTEDNSGTDGGGNQSAMEAEDNSRKDGDGGKKGIIHKTTTFLQQAEAEDGNGDDESGRNAEPLVLTEEEYKLTEEGTLTTVKVTRGGTTHRTNTEVDRVLAEVGIQAESLQQKIRNFSVRKFIKQWGKKEPGLEDLKFNPAMYESKDGVSNITQWTATELTLQRAQLVRIARDGLFLVWAFSFFGAVRILEALLKVFSTNPPNFMKLMDGMNAMDPLTVASLAHALRKPIVGMLEVDPTNLEEVSSLKVKFWTELHKFFERQWKVIATLGFARFCHIVVTRLPSAEWFTARLRVVWDITMALPIF
ncbi:unnamed protein product [Calypogeia fissa]